MLIPTQRFNFLGRWWTLLHRLGTVWRIVVGRYKRRHVEGMNVNQELSMLLGIGNEITRESFNHDGGLGMCLRNWRWLGWWRFRWLSTVGIWNCEKKNWQSSCQRIYSGCLPAASIGRGEGRVPIFEIRTAYLEFGSVFLYYFLEIKNGITSSSNCSVSGYMIYWRTGTVLRLQSRNNRETWSGKVQLSEPHIPRTNIFNADKKCVHR